MTNAELKSATVAAKTETKEALQTVYDSLNQGQQKKLLKDPVVAELFERYGVEVEG